ncbi:anti-sigma factor [Rhizosphaericola mali]|uniref:Anti-sigma factor n=1 Tax=Rhizosphaericola mali TaxID=2545455 RepID=A0A5P2G3B8_9BACT|nr:anti-sigma factor [Rhizosphaericola mali]QES88312.1 anti-sigma factor [Rhizosphaericola mali]
MDIKAYILSGIIETYVLGIATESEVSELLSLAAQYPEIRLAIDACESNFENALLKNPIEPPIGLKEKIWSEITKDNMVNESDISVTSEKSEISSQIPTQQSTVSIWNKWLLAASIIGILICLGFIYNYQKQNKEYALQIGKLKYKGKKIEEENNILQLISLPTVNKVVLNGVATHANNMATVYWDSISKAAYLVLNNLPQPPTDKQYQLWALVDGKPIDAGLYNSETTINHIQKLKNVLHADMFAITMEPKGGSKSPTMEQMYVAGKL